MIKIFIATLLIGCSLKSLAQNIGIGTTTPSEKLDVSGNIKGDTAKLNSLKITPNASTGKVLTSDVNGVASWQVSGINVKALNGLSKKQDSILLGGRLLDSTRFYLSGKKIIFLDNDGVTQTIMASVTTFSPNTVLSATPITQTFKTTSDYLIKTVELYLNSLPFTNTTMQIKNSSGTVLSTANFSSPVIVSGWQVFTFLQPVAMNASEVYSLSITGTAGTQMFYNSSNAYLDGECSIGSTTDIAFIIKVLQENAVLTIKNNKVGIGTTNPDTTFHIVGSIKIADGTEGADRIFTSDANGLGKWSSIAAADINGWGTSGNAGTNAVNHFIGTLDYTSLNIRVNNRPSGKIDPLLKNTFWGYNSGILTTTGKNNTASGSSSFLNNTTGSYNTANGLNSIYSNTTGNHNTANGYISLYFNTSGSYNTATGDNSLFSCTTGNHNTAFGSESLFSTNGINNTGIGNKAGYIMTGGSNNIAIGYDAQVDYNTNSNQIRIGNQNITLATTKVSWSTSSDARYKEQIRTIPFGLNFIEKLRPVDYMRTNNKKADNGANPETLESGFVAQEVEQVLIDLGYENSGMISKNESGYYSMRYNDLLAPMVKAIQELQQLISIQQKVKDEQQKLINTQQKENDALKIQNKQTQQRLDKLEKLVFKN